jgi:hypothetical protein
VNLRPKIKLTPEEIDRRDRIIRNWQNGRTDLCNDANAQYGIYKQEREDADLPLEVSRNDFRRLVKGEPGRRPRKGV